MVGKMRRRFSARACLRADERYLTDGGAFSGMGVERPLGSELSVDAVPWCLLLVGAGGGAMPYLVMPLAVPVSIGVVRSPSPS